MDATLKAKWVEALRSGEYRQTKGKLKREDGFCCLGVLCIVAGYGIDAANDRVLTPDGANDVLSYGPFDVIGVDDEKRYQLISRNDSGTSFSEIAAYIERAL